MVIVSAFSRKQQQLQEICEHKNDLMNTSVTTCNSILKKKILVNFLVLRNGWMTDFKYEKNSFLFEQ